MRRAAAKNHGDLRSVSAIVARMRTRERPTRRRSGAAVAGFTTALAFLTRIPVAAAPFEDGALAKAAWAFPLVGAGVGAVAGIVFLAAESIGLGDDPAALLAILAGLVVTGALHEDGLADAADGLLGGGDRERRLAIMRDSRHGTFAVLALVMSVGLRAAALARIGDPLFAGLALVAAHAGSRALLAPVLWGLSPARDDGLGAGAGRPRPAIVGCALGIALAIVLAALGPLAGLLAFGVAAATVAAAAAFARQSIGGYTGDVLGAVQQLGEITILLAAVVLR
jgi:adenosylcobinamide-GDP ribazoletransferase